MINKEWRINMEQNMLGMRPALGWNSWNTFTWDINEKLIFEIADCMVEKGYRDMGYEYIVIDDCWSLKERDAAGQLVADPNKFPHGMKAVADYIHSKGLKFGMYSCAGTHTCAGYPGSFEHEFEDAKQFAEWNVDYLKYDYCFKPREMSGELLYKRMSLALRTCGRDILLSACNWGEDNVYDWIRSSGAHSYRSTGDIQDSWDSIKNIALSQIKKDPFTGSFCHNDMDMLVVGMNGGSNDDFIKDNSSGCSLVQYKSHFSLWCLMGSPLMIGCDIRNTTKHTETILQNKELISINQDIESRGAYRIKVEPQWFSEEEAFVLAKVLHNGDIAIGLFNLSDEDKNLSIQFWDLGISYSSGKSLALHDCWKNADLGEYKERYSCKVAANDCIILRATLV